MPTLFDSGSLPATRSANAKISSAMYASLTTGSTFVDGTGGRTPRILAARSRASCRRFAMITDSPIIYSPLSWARYIYHRAHLYNAKRFRYSEGAGLLIWQHILPYPVTSNLPCQGHGHLSLTRPLCVHNNRPCTGAHIYPIT